MNGIDQFQAGELVVLDLDLEEKTSDDIGGDGSQYRSGQEI